MYRRWCSASELLFTALKYRPRTTRKTFGTVVEPKLRVGGDDYILVRDFIQSALYDEKNGYFVTSSGSVGELDFPINFSELEGRRAYMQYLHNIYKRGNACWYTPVELFQPYYGYALAKYILAAHVSSEPLRIYEIGGGTGTCARNILDYIRAHASRTVFDTMTYVSVEISAELAKKQYQNVVLGEKNRKQYRVECRNASDRNGWGLSQKEPCVVVMLEVLDNLPHDLVFRDTPDSPWMEKWVAEKIDGELLASPLEMWKPVEDNQIIRCLEAMGLNTAADSSFRKRMKNLVLKLLKASNLVWVPTGCLKLLKTLHSARPYMKLVTSDFSTLPDVKVSGHGAPIVSSKEGGENMDHTSVFEAKGRADIFFPTDFSLLQRLDERCALENGVSRVTSVMSPAQFMDLFAEHAKTATRDGYNPLLEDFSNTKMYISTPGKSQK